MRYSYIDDFLDIVLFIVMLVIYLTMTLSFISSINSDMNEFVLGDKTALKSNNDNTPKEVKYYVPDILCLLLVADEYQTYPNRISINRGNPIVFDKEYRKDSIHSITSIWNNQLKDIESHSVKRFTIDFDQDGNPFWDIITER